MANPSPAVDLHVAPATFREELADVLALKVNRLPKWLAIDARDRAVAQWANVVDDFMLEAQEVLWTFRNGVGSPQGAVAAPPGMLYLDTATSPPAAGRLWVKNSGTGTTGWAAVGGGAIEPGTLDPDVLTDGDARSVLGVPGNAQAARVDIAAGGARRVLASNAAGTAIAFRALEAADIPEPALVLWAQERDIDCSAEAANDWNAGGDGTYSLGGLTWTIVNTGVADTFGPDGATGVRFNASANATVFNNSSKTATHMWIAALTLIPNFDPLAEYVVEFGFSSLTLGASDDQVSCFFWSSNGNRTFRAGRRNSSGSHQTFALLDTNQNGTTGYTDTAFALKINANVASIASGAFAAGAFPTLYPHLGSHVALNGTSPIQSPIFDPPNLRIGFAWCSNAAGNADSTLARIRIWRRRGLFG